ncbi:MAG: YdcH family protein [Acidobacteriia bacterium]|nr:YdcH family protein [Terriglobia bacterium]
MSSLQRNPGEQYLDADAEYQKLAEQHTQYEAELHRLTLSPYLSAEDLLEEVRLKKLKLRVKDEMQQLLKRQGHACA